MKLKYTVAMAMALSAFAASAATDPSPNEHCAPVIKAAQDAKNAEISNIDKERRNAAKAAAEAQSCLARAGDNILRSAIPPSISSILGVLTDPDGYIRNATSNAACNVITNEANKTARGASDVNGTIRKAGSDAQGVFTGGVDDALGGKGASRGGYYTNEAKTEDQSFFKSMSCRLFGRC